MGHFFQIDHRWLGVHIADGLISARVVDEFAHLAVLVHQAAEYKGIGRTGLYAGRCNLPVGNHAFFIFGVVVGDFDALDAK